MAERIASLYAEIGADTSGLQRGLTGAKKELTETASQLGKFNTKFTGDFVGGLQRGSAGLDIFGGQLLAAAQKAEIGTTDISRMARATGFYTDKQVLAARASAMGAQKADELAAAVQRGEISTREAGRQMGEFARQNMIAADSTSRVISSVTAIAKGVAIAGAAFAAVGFAAKKAFDVIKEGAELEYARERYDRLASSIGTVSDVLLDDLKKATRGTVSDVQLVASAADFMALGLAKSHNEVVRLTRVAGALGMNMNQLVLTLTNQTTMRFDALGVSVDGFDDRLKKLKETGLDTNAAFTEAFLQQAEAQIERVGDVADTTAGKVKMLEGAWQDYMAILKLDVAGMGAGGAGGLGGFLRLMVDLRNAVDKGNVSWWEAQDILARVSMSSTTAADGQELLKQKTLDLNREMYAYSQRLQQLAEREYPGAEEAASAFTSSLTVTTDEIMKQRQETERAHGAGRDWADMLYEGEDAADAAAAANERLAEEVAESGKEAKDAAEEWKNFLDSIDRHIESPIANFIQDLEWMITTGGRFEEAFATVQQALEENKITPQQAKDFAEELYTAVIDVKEETGEIKFDEAATNLSETLGISLKNAKDAISGTDGIAGAMDALTATEYSLNEQLLQSVVGVQDAIDGPGDSIASALADVTDQDYEIVVNVRYNDPGFRPNIPEGVHASGLSVITPHETTIGEPEEGWASGVSGFIVPPGYPNDSYLVGLTSGERVDVAPVGGGRRPLPGAGAVYQGDQFITIVNRTGRAAAQTRSVLAARGWSRLNESMG